MIKTAITFITLASATLAYADHSEPGLPSGGDLAELAETIHELQDAALNAAEQARYNRDLVAVQRYNRIAQNANEMDRAVDDLMANSFEVERAIQLIRVNMRRIEEQVRGIARVDRRVAYLVRQLRAEVEQLSEGGGVIIVPPHEPHLGLVEAVCEVTIYNGSAMTLSVSGKGRSEWEAIRNARANAERQCRANAGSCQHGECSVNHIDHIH